MAVLAGILAAFGVDAAWQARSDNLREASYVTALAAELDSNGRMVEDALGQLGEEIPIVRGFFDSIILFDSKVPDDQILTMVRYMGLGRALKYERSALTDLLNSGGLEYIKKSETRRAIATYERQLNELAGAHEALRTYWEAQLSPYYVNHANMPEMFNKLDDVFEGYDFPTTGFSVDQSAFVENRTFANLFSNYLFFTEVVRREQLRLLTSVQELALLLGAS